MYVVLLLVQCAIFGFSFIVIKNILNQGAPPLFLMSIRFSIGFLALLLLGVTTGRTKKFRSADVISRQAELRYGVIAGLVLFSAFALQTFGAEITTPAKNGLLTGTFVVFVPICVMALNRKFSLQPLLVSALCFIGVVVVANISTADLSMNVGDALSVACGLFFAVHFILLGWYAPDPRIDVLRFTQWQLLVVALLSTAGSALTERYELSDRSVDLWNSWPVFVGTFIFLGVVSTSVTYLIQTVVQARLSPISVSVISCSESVFAIIISVVAGFEPLTASLSFGAVLIVAAMVLASIHESAGSISREERQSNARPPQL